MACISRTLCHNPLRRHSPSLATSSLSSSRIALSHSSSPFSSSTTPPGFLFSKNRPSASKRALCVQAIAEAPPAAAAAAAAEAPPATDGLVMNLKVDGSITDALLPKVTEALKSIEGITKLKVFAAEGLATVEGLLSFKKYQGLGNDFILVDNRDSSQPKVSPEQAKVLCDRNFGIGADGVIFAMPGVNGSDYTMRIFNSDGSEPEMCGNGIRCMAQFVAELENAKETRSYNIHTLAGLIIPKLRDDGQVEVDMGSPILNAADVPTQLPSNKDGFVIKEPLFVEGMKWLVTCVSMGNPHCVVFASEESEALDVNSLPLESIGPHFEHHKVFPARTNTEFVQVLSPSHLRMRVWERGAGATLACGTGACAVVVAAVLEGRTSKKCTVDLPGGPLEIEWREDNHVYMTGPAKAVFEGRALL